MTHDLACMLCMIGPQATNMLLPVAQATAIALPILFRENIAAAIRRARGGEPRAEEGPSDQGGAAIDDVDDDDDDSVPPGGVYP